MTIAERLTSVRRRIEEAERTAGRPAGSTRLMAVSKRKTAEDVRAAYAAGQRDFGENYVQELVDKAAQLTDLTDLRWHFIGHLQRNKARQVVRVASSVHSLDRSRLAEELGKRAAGAERSLDVLIEVNVGGEEQKSGCRIGEAAEVLATIREQSALNPVGLMTVPPHTEDPAGARPFFERLRALRDELGGSATLPELSMGMTHDLEHAVDTGATWVRVGTAIFGPRT